MMDTQQFTSQIITPKTHKVVLYFVNELELDALERGSTASVFLTFGLSLFSIFCSFALVIFSTPIKSNRIFDVFVIIASVSLISSVVLLILWYRSDDEAKKIIRCIKERFPEGEQSESTGRYDIESGIELNNHKTME